MRFLFLELIRLYIAIFVLLKSAKQRISIAIRARRINQRFATDKIARKFVWAIVCYAYGNQNQ
ncbi:MAG: hypothetical protein CFE23_03840 [Flavobacterium sp. BFFFF1]|nr:MAG: hypothetical protein CFE23_03840 [Flavobacterium sp. BFFFF1]